MPANNRFVGLRFGPDKRFDEVDQDTGAARPQYLFAALVTLQAHGLLVAPVLPGVFYAHRPALLQQ